MNTTDSLLRELDDPALGRDERARLWCQLAADFESEGRYEAARSALGELWQGAGRRPDLDGLTDLTAAAALLRVGTLSSWFGSAEQLEGVQEAAKDLINESITRFEAIGEPVRAALARSELAFCYWREGALDEARVLYAEALRGLSEPEHRASVLLRLSIVESVSGRHHDALRILTDAAPLFEASANHFLKGKFHNELSFLLSSVGKQDRRADYADRAILELTAAAYHFEQAGHTAYRALAENNLGFLLHLAGRHADAHEHLNRARRLFASEQNRGRIAQVDDTRARVLLAEGRVDEASKVIHGAVRTLSKGGEQSLLAEALTTQGLVMSRAGNVHYSQTLLRRAADAAERVGAVEDAGRALLTLVEEHAEYLPEYELLEAYRRADGLLKNTQDPETVARLRAAADSLIGSRLESLQSARGRRKDAWANFSLSEMVRRVEARYIRRALVEAKGSVSHAAHLLGFKHHASLASLLERRHRDLAHLRTPVERRKSAFRRGRRDESKTRNAKAAGEDAP